MEILFDGLRMGGFDGGLAYMFYPGSRLIQQDAVRQPTTPTWCTTTTPDSTSPRPPIVSRATTCAREAVFYDTDGALRHLTLTGLQSERVPVQARYRTLA